MTDAGDPIRDAFARACSAIDAQLEGHLEPLVALAHAVAGIVAPAEPGTLRDADLAGLVPEIRGRMESTPALVGYGFAAAPGVMRDRDRYLMWYQQRAGGVRRLTLNLTPGDPDLYDYLDMDWFTRAEQLGVPSLFGPYVDYAGAEFLVLTIAVPVLVGQRFVGVAGADLDPNELERGLVSALRGLPGDAVVVNADRSVLAAGTARWMPGERLPMHPAREPERWLAVASLAPWTSWTVALAARETD